MHDELSLLAGAGLIIKEKCNGVTEFCNGQPNQQGLNQVAFGEKWSLRRDLDP